MFKVQVDKIQTRQIQTIILGYETLALTLSETRFSSSYTVSCHIFKVGNIKVMNPRITADLDLSMPSEASKPESGPFSTWNFQKLAAQQSLQPVCMTSSCIISN